MKILIDIGHPAHVHYFKNFIYIMGERGHKIYVTARNREIILKLLSCYEIQYKSRGAGLNSLLGKLTYILVGDIKIYRFAKHIDPDLFLSFGSTYAAHASFMLRKPHIAFDDTEHAFFEHILYVPFSDLVLTPKDFRKNFGRKHIRFDGSMDLCYLHPNYYKPNKNVYNHLGLEDGDRYIFMRFVAWKASHDVGQKGLLHKYKIEAVRNLSLNHKIFISSENKLPSDLQEYELRISPDRIHDVLYYADLFWGESGSMASEACVLGTPAINIATSAKLVGVFDEFINNKLLYIIPDNAEAIKKAIDLLNTPDLKVNSRKIATKMLSTKIDVTKLMIWLVENYPQSKELLIKKTLISKQDESILYDKYFK